MRDIFEKIKLMLSSSSEPGRTFIHEVIDRSEDEMNAVEQWKYSDRKELLFSNINTFLRDPDSDYPSFQNFQNERSYTFVLYFEGSGMHKSEMHYFFDLLKDNVLQLDYDYLLYMSDRKIKPEKGFSVKTIERHYLKPSRKKWATNEKVEQHYGNIAIEHHLRNDVPEFVKLNASYYQDSLYEKAREFPELLQSIFK